MCFIIFHCFFECGSYYLIMFIQIPSTCHLTAVSRCSIQLTAPEPIQGYLQCDLDFSGNVNFIPLDLYNTWTGNHYFWRTWGEKDLSSAPSRPGLTWDPGTPPSKQISFLGVRGGSKQKYISVPVTVNPQCGDLLTTGRGRTSAFWPTMTIYFFLISLRLFFYIIFFLNVFFFFKSYFNIFISFLFLFKKVWD